MGSSCSRISDAPSEPLPPDSASQGQSAEDAQSGNLSGQSKERVVDAGIQEKPAVREEVQGGPAAQQSEGQVNEVSSRPFLSRHTWRLLMSGKNTDGFKMVRTLGEST